MARPKRVFTDEEEQKIKEYALCNCLTNTIAVALNIPLMTLKRRYGKRLTHWRAQYKVKLRANQQKMSESSADMLKFLGKNVLNQTDKQVIETKAPIAEVPESERKAVEAGCLAYKLKLTGPNTYEKRAPTVPIPGSQARQA